MTVGQLFEALSNEDQDSEVFYEGGHPISSVVVERDLYNDKTHAHDKQAVILKS